MIEILTVLFLAVALRLIFFISPDLSDDDVHLYMMRLRQLRATPFDYYAADSFLGGKQGYPQLFHFLISRFPRKFWIVAARVSNMVLDLIIILIVFVISLYVIKNIAIVDQLDPVRVAAYGAALVATSPLLLPTTARAKALGARIFGFFIFNISSVLIFFLLNADSWLVICALICSLSVLTIIIVLSSQFALQALIWVTLCLSLIYWNVLPFFSVVFALFLCIKTPRFGAKDILIAKKNHWIWYRNNLDNGTTATLKNRLVDIIRLPALLCTHPLAAVDIVFSRSSLMIFAHSAMPFAILCYLYLFDLDAIKAFYNHSASEFAFVLTGCGFAAYALTLLKPLKFLGEPERYLEYVLPAAALSLVALASAGVLSIQDIFALISFQISISLLNLVYANGVFLKSSLAGRESSEFASLLSFLACESPKKILTVPTKLAYKIGCRGGQNTFYYQHLLIEGDRLGYHYMDSDSVRKGFITPDFASIRCKYGINLIIFCKNSLIKLEEQGLKYPIDEAVRKYESERYLVVDLDAEVDDGV